MRTKYIAIRLYKNKPTKANYQRIVKKENTLLLNNSLINWEFIISLKKVTFIIILNETSIRNWT